MGEAWSEGSLEGDGGLEGLEGGEGSLEGGEGSLEGVEGSLGGDGDLGGGEGSLVLALEGRFLMSQVPLYRELNRASASSSTLSDTGVPRS